MSNVLKTLGAVGVLSIVVLAIFWPLVIIWAVNTLFAFDIAYTFWTWLAVLVLTISFGKARITTNKDK